MCLAVPVRLTEIRDDEHGVAEFHGTRREVGLQLIEEPQVGDYVLVHAGFAIQKLDPEDARKTLDMWDELAALEPGS